jgi:hypothetical protein
MKLFLLVFVMSLIHCPLPKHYSRLVPRKYYLRVFHKMMYKGHEDSTIGMIPSKDNIWIAGQRADKKVDEIVKEAKTVADLNNKDYKLAAIDLINEWVGWNPKPRPPKRVMTPELAM